MFENDIQSAVIGYKEFKWPRNAPKEFEDENS